jgi:hypothetical protein
MEVDKHHDLPRIKHALAWYNMIPNLFWSILNLVPISVFCYKYINLKILLVFICLSLLTVFLPKSFFQAIQLGKTITIYNRIGVRFINKFTQNGDIINSLIRKRFPHYKAVTNRKQLVNKLIQQTLVYEKFHFILFTFFIFVFVYATANEYWWWALIITVTNIVYNIYPSFLQQYIRIKLASAEKKLLVK